MEVIRPLVAGKAIFGNFPTAYAKNILKLATLVKPSCERVADTLRNFYLWLTRAIPENLLTVIDRRNMHVCAAE